MRIFFYLFIFFQISIANSQSLNCLDLKKGKFKAYVDKPFKVEFEIIRKDSTQTERPIFVPERFKSFATLDKIYTKIKWISKCSYNLKFDETKMELEKSQIEMNNEGGVNVKIVKIEGKCFYYKSSMNVNKKEIIIDGKLCKEDN